MSFAEAKRRFAGFRAGSIIAAERVGATPSPISWHQRRPCKLRTGYWHSRRKDTVTNERLALTIARLPAPANPALAGATLALTLTDEPAEYNRRRRDQPRSPHPASSPTLPGTSSRRITMLWRQSFGPSFRDSFVANFMTNFSDGPTPSNSRIFAPAQADIRRPGNDGPRAGNDRDISRSQDPRVAGDRGLDRPAQRNTAVRSKYPATASATTALSAIQPKMPARVGNALPSAAKANTQAIVTMIPVPRRLRPIQGAAISSTPPADQATVPTAIPAGSRSAGAAASMVARANTLVSPRTPGEGTADGGHA